ncbi:MAG: hypothetical protein JF888_08885 [Candidatus Dormibacteraeota bacterium]|uniref:Uncharacterized protein n=1 Tax=Candidatus Dormiibacter inghamiae TaxID=3127013 RepID=A0A934KGY0_9BACT|nr:hypothetical protein [Candidatus Dormibacteraeota bacterium]MBJ7606488.1 hypothetical protein [Candidatus Dormibacteraeota bacterium]
MLRKDDLHLSKLVVNGMTIPPVMAAGPMGVMAPQALTPREGSEIYAEVSRYGFTGFQVVQGGIQLMSSDGMSIVVLTGGGWQFTEDLSRTTFDHSADKLAVVIDHYVKKLPQGTILAGQVAQVEAVWENFGADADSYIEQRFLKPEFARVVEGLVEGQEMLGGGVRMVLKRPAEQPLPPGMATADPSGPADVFEVKVEPLYADRTKLFLLVSGTFSPTVDFKVIERRTRSIRDLLWSKLATNMTLEA